MLFRSAKEAVYKALSKLTFKYDFKISFKDIEILNNPNLNNRPYVAILENENTKNFFNLNLLIDISISHTNYTAIATVIAYNT